MSRDPRWGYGPTFFRNLLDDEELTGRYDSGTLRAQDDVGRWLRSHHRHIHLHSYEGPKEDLRKQTPMDLVDLRPEDFESHGAYLNARLSTPHEHLGGPLSLIKRNWSPDEAVSQDEWKEIHSHEAFPQSKKHSEGQIIRIQVPALMPDNTLGIEVHGTTVTKVLDRRARDCGWLTGDQILRINGRVVANGMEYKEHSENAMEVHRITSRPILFDIWRHPQRQPRGVAPPAMPAPHYPPQPVPPQVRPQVPQQPYPQAPPQQPHYPGYPAAPGGPMPPQQVPATRPPPPLQPPQFPGPARVPSPVVSPVPSYVPPPYGPVSPVASHVPMATATISTGPGGTASPIHMPMAPCGPCVPMASATIQTGQGLVSPRATHVPMAVPLAAPCVPMASATIQTGGRPGFPPMQSMPAHGRTASPVASPQASFVAYPPSHGPSPLSMPGIPFPQQGYGPAPGRLPSTPSVYGGTATRYGA